MSTDYEALFKAIDRSQGRIEFDSRRVIVDVNQNYLDMMGYERHELLGQKHSFLVPDDYAASEEYEEFWLTLLGGEFHRAEYQRVGRDGAPRWFQATYNPIMGEYGEVRRIVECASDVTSLKKAEALALIVADAPFPVYVHRQSDLRVIEANQGAIAALGYSREELLKLTPLDYDRGLTADQIDTLLAPLVAGELHKIEFPTVHRRKSGETFPVQVSVHTTEFGGEPVYLCFVSDLTEIKSLERQLFQAEKWNSIGRLASGIAHEINTPIQFICNNVNYLRRIMGQWNALHASVSELVGPGGDEELDGLREILPDADDLRDAEEALEDCLLGVARVSEIVGAMKEFAHPGSEDGAPFDINQCVRNAATITKNAATKHATLDLDLTDCDQVQGSSSELSQAFVNLIVNAADAIEEASLTGAETGRITVSTRQTRGRVVVKVTDTGCGMPPEVAAHAFDPFYTTKGVGKGSGQGLAIAYNAVVEKCGGEIKLDSSPGEGTTFTITLPAVCPVHRPAEVALAAL